MPIRPFSPAGRDTMVLTLSWAAGAVDAISYLGLGHVFTANMTGNTVLLGVALGQGRGFAALRSVVALGGFALGAALGAIIVARGQKRGDWPPAVTRAILFEGVILGIFSLTWQLSGKAPAGTALHALLVLSALAMGIQSAAIRHLNVPGIATTYITGTLTSLMAGLAGRLLHKAALASTAGSPGEASPSSVAQKKHTTRLQAAVLFIYGLAAVASGLLQMRLPWLVAFSPFLAVALVLANALLRHRYEAVR